MSSASCFKKLIKPKGSFGNTPELVVDVGSAVFSWGTVSCKDAVGLTLEGEMRIW